MAFPVCCGRTWLAAQIPDLKPIQHLWDELKHEPRARVYLLYIGFSQHSMVNWVLDVWESILFDVRGIRAGLKCIHMQSSRMQRVSIYSIMSLYLSGGANQTQCVCALLTEVWDVPFASVNNTTKGRKVSTPSSPSNCSLHVNQNKGP